MTREAGDRQQRGERAGAVEDVHLCRQDLNQVGERQPDGADLLPSGCDAVDDAAGDDEMRLGVVVAEDEALAEVEDPRGEPGAAARPRRAAALDVVRGL